jgi:hypothetical protein
MPPTALMLDYYTVVPIMPLSGSAFACFSAPDYVQESELGVDREVLNQIAGYKTKNGGLQEATNDVHVTRRIKNF